MESLEYLIQHYMKFSDGLPINLRHGVPPKPKPPLPALFPTMSRNPKIKSPINKPTTVRDEKLPINGNNNGNISLPNDALMNTVGLLDNSTSSNTNTNLNTNTTKKCDDKHTVKTRKDSIFNSLKFSKKKQKEKENLKHSTSQPDNYEPDITSSFRDISFTTDLYNTPKNNGAVVFTTMAEINSPTQEDIQNQNVLQTIITSPKSQQQQQQTSTTTDPNRDYFTESDDIMCAAIATEQGDKSVEEIYFIDAPTIAKSDFPITSFQYVPFTDMFPDGTTTTIIDNNNVTQQDSQQQKKEKRSTNVVSMVSVTDSEFMKEHTTGPESPGIAAKPNYFIPKSHLQLNEILGQGEFGSVYRGILKLTKKLNESAEEIPVAIKTLHDDHCKENRQEFLREASVMLKLSHHCIVKLIGITKVKSYNFVFANVAHKTIKFFRFKTGSTIKSCTRTCITWFNA